MSHHIIVTSRSGFMHSDKLGLSLKISAMIVVTESQLANLKYLRSNLQKKRKKEIQTFYCIWKSLVLLNNNLE